MTNFPELELFMNIIPKVYTQNYTHLPRRAVEKNTLSNTKTHTNTHEHSRTHTNTHIQIHL